MGGESKRILAIFAVFILSPVYEFGSKNSVTGEIKRKIRHISIRHLTSRSEKKWLTVNCKKIVWIVFSRKKSPNANYINLIFLKLKYLWSVLTKQGKCDTEFLTRIGIANDVFQMQGSIRKYPEWCYKKEKYPAYQLDV